MWRNSGIVLALVLALGACSDSHEQSVRDAAVVDETPRALSADDLFAESCAEFTRDDASDALVNGLDDAGIAHINAALKSAKEAATADPARFKAYSDSFQTFAEGMGDVVATVRDRGSTPQDVLKAASKVEFPLATPKCPPHPRDSGGLPLPSASATN